MKRILIAALSAVIIGGFWLFLKYSKFGVWIRATTQDRIMAQINRLAMPPFRAVDVVRAALGDNCGLVGAAALALLPSI